MSIFDELKASLEEANEIKNGSRPASKETKFEVNPSMPLRNETNVPTLEPILPTKKNLSRD